MPKKILIIGAYGFIGSHLAKYMLNYTKDYELTLWDIGCYTGKPSDEVVKARKKGLPKLNIHFEDKEYDIVIHLGSVAGCRSDIDAGLMFSNNNGLLQMMLSGLKYKRFIYISSYCVKGDVDTPYAISKRIAEAQCYTYVNKNSMLTVRLPMVYGELGRPDMLLTKIFNNEKILFNGNPSNIYRYAVYVGDVVEHLVRLIDEEISGIANFINKKSYSMKQILDITDTTYECTNIDVRDYMTQFMSSHQYANEVNVILPTTLEEYMERKRKNGQL